MICYFKNDVCFDNYVFFKLIGISNPSQSGWKFLEKSHDTKKNRGLFWSFWIFFLFGKKAGHKILEKNISFVC